MATDPKRFALPPREAAFLVEAKTQLRARTNGVDVPSSQILAAAVRAWARERSFLCKANREGDCKSATCPQLRDGEPVKSGRHCPLDIEDWDGE